MLENAGFQSQSRASCIERVNCNKLGQGFGEEVEGGGDGVASAGAGIGASKEASEMKSKEGNESGK